MNKVVLLDPKHDGTLTPYMLVFSLVQHGHVIFQLVLLFQFYKWEFPHLIYVGKCHTKLLFSIKDRRMRFVYVGYI